MEAPHLSVTFLKSFSWLVLVPLFLVVLYRASSAPLRTYFLRRFTSVEGLPALGRKRGAKINGTAVICGGRYALALHIDIHADDRSIDLLAFPAFSRLACAQIISHMFSL